MPPTDFCNYVSIDVRARTKRLSLLAGTMAMTTFRFLRAGALSLAGAAARGEPRCVRCRRPLSRFLLTSARFARLRYRRDRATTEDFRRRCVVTIDEHGSEDRVKDVSSEA
jgi:hypothetical protein